MKNRAIWYALLAFALLFVPARVQARWMHPHTGRFWTMDANEGASDDPQSLHKFLYVGNDAVNKQDATGAQYTINEVTATVSGANTVASVKGPPPGRLGLSGQAGPDVTKILNKTMLDVKLTYGRW